MNSSRKNDVSKHKYVMCISNIQSVVGNIPTYQSKAELAEADKLVNFCCCKQLMKHNLYMDTNGLE